MPDLLAQAGAARRTRLASRRGEIIGAEWAGQPCGGRRRRVPRFGHNPELGLRLTWQLAASEADGKVVALMADIRLHHFSVLLTGGDDPSQLLRLVSTIHRRGVYLDAAHYLPCTDGQRRFEGSVRATSAQVAVMLASLRSRVDVLSAELGEEIAQS